MSKKAKAGRGGARPGAGRKALDPSERRSALLQCNVTEAEALVVTQSAEMRGMTVSDYLRLRALGRKIPAAIRSARD